MTGTARPEPSHLDDLVAVMDRLRSPGGCPWDAEQTHASLVPFAIEEVFEVAEAVETGDRANLREELGDLLLQVVFHTRVAQEHAEDPFDLEDVAAGIAEKLRRRHPHVFAEVEDLGGAEDVHRRWERLKQEEKARDSVFDGIPVAMPSLARAQKVVGRAVRAGLAAPAPVVIGDAAELGELLLGIASAAHAAGLDAEAALRSAVRRFEAASRDAERDVSL